jgi:hypothetical protein
LKKDQKNIDQEKTEKKWPQDRENIVKRPKKNRCKPGERPRKDSGKTEKDHEKIGERQGQN